MDPSSMLRRYFRCLCVATLILGAGLGTPSRAVAEEPAEPSRDRGKELALKGLEAYKNGKYEEARAAFAEARGLYPAGQVLRMLGYSLVALERWAEAADALEAALHAELKPLPEADRVEAQTTLDKALSHLGTLTIVSNVPGATVAIDTASAEPLPVRDRRMAVGSHHVVVRATEREPIDQQVVLKGGQAQSLELDPLPATAGSGPGASAGRSPSAPGSLGPWQLVGIVGGTAGLALAGAGIAALVDWRAQQGSVDDRTAAYQARYAQGCPLADYTGCATDAALINRDADRAKSAQNAGIGLTIAGGVVGVAGFTLLAVMSSSAPSEPGAAPTQGAERVSWACVPSPELGLGLGLGCGGTF